VPNNPKIVVLGAGSAAFGLAALGDFLKQPDFNNGTLCMVDIDTNKLDLITGLANGLKEKYESSMELLSNKNRREVLQDADFVILVIGVNRDDTWKQDFELGKKFGIYHYAENGGPGSFGHTSRNISVLMPILRDIEDLAPKSWVINFTNPLPRVHYAINKFTKLKCISFCHQFWHGHYILGQIMRPDLEKRSLIKTTNDYLEIRNASLQEYDVTAAGINHFTWMMDIKRNRTFEDLYPIVRHYTERVPVEFEKLTLHMFKIFELLPVPGETHLSEYLPYTHSKHNWKRYNLYNFNFEENKKNRIKNMQKIRDMISGKLSYNYLNSDPAERLVNIVHEIFTNAKKYEPAINIENNGLISNISDDAIVEVPCVVTRRGANGIHIGKLPEAIAAICNREVTIAKLITNGSVKGDREAVIQAFALDPMVNDLELAEKLATAYIDEFKKSLPQFFGNSLIE
jgi:alpha-galactosidase